ncbi:MAG TPA: DUF4250 domain-containing protein [Mobilitalea sp.]|nr:DUF4250 domain-containing protein [Mobilitalea sp.]
MKTPNNPHMLLSYINTKLRDDYKTLGDLCKSLDIDELHLEKALSSIDYAYNKELNRFTATL